MSLRSSFGDFNVSLGFPEQATLPVESLSVVSFQCHGGLSDTVSICIVPNPLFAS